MRFDTFLTIALSSASLLVAPSLLASGNHHSAPMGGRSALMGGTGVALGVDGAAPFLNPATITRIAGGKLAFASRFYRFSRATYSDFYAPGPVDESVFGDVEFGDTGVVDHRLHSVPDSVCYFFPALGKSQFRKQRLSLCLTTIQEQELSLTALGFRRSSGGTRVDQTQHFDQSWSRFNFGPTWGSYLNKRLALGASLLVAFSRYQHAMVSNSVAETSAGSAVTSSYQSLVSAASWDTTLRLGATYDLTERWSLGASVTLPLFHVLGTLRHTHLRETTTSRTQWAGEGSFSAKPPLEIRVGLGGEWESVRFEANAFVTPGTSEFVHGEIEREEITVEAGQVVSRTPSTFTVNERSKTVVNLAAGAEVFVSPRFSVLFGAQTDVNALEDLNPDVDEARLFRAKLDYYRTGAGICSYTDYGDLMVGLRFDYGVGDSTPVNTLTFPTALGRSDVSEFGVMAVLAGSLNWDSIRQAVDDLGEVVSGTSDRPPKAPPKPLQKPKREN